jgi:hypothetical protein
VCTGGSETIISCAHDRGVDVVRGGAVQTLKIRWWYSNMRMVSHEETSPVVRSLKLGKKESNRDRKKLCHEPKSVWKLQETSR